MSDIVNGPEQIFSSADSILTEAHSQAPTDAGPARPEREGLPRSYRMRADRHYVDQIASRAAGQPVRMVPVGEIDSTDACQPADLRTLLESMRSHGVVHPLLVRRTGARYAVVAGRKRLAAAQILRLVSVPCLVQELDDAQAAALAMADNLTVTPVAQAIERSDVAQAVKQLIANHLAAVRSCSDLVSTGGPASNGTTGLGRAGSPGAFGTLGLMSRSIFDLIKANVWRAARLSDVLDLITNAALPSGRDRRLSTILDEIVDGFAAEGRLSGFVLQAHAIDDVSSSGTNSHEILAGLSAAVMATLPLVAHVPAYADLPTVTIKSAAAGPGSIVIDVSQSAAAVSPSVVRRFLEGEATNAQEGGWAAAASVIAVKGLADRYDGRAAFEAVSNGGSTLRLTLVRRS